MKRFWAWLALAVGLIYFALPLLGMTEFSLKMRRGDYSFDAYAKVLADPKFQETFTFSVAMALATILFGVLLVVPTAYWVRLKLPRLRPYIEFVTLLPLVIPAIVIVFGYIRLYNTSSWLPLTGTAMGTNILLLFGYATLSLPYMYRAVDTGLRTIDVATLTEAAQTLGAGWVTILARVILPNVWSRSYRVPLSPLPSFLANSPWQHFSTGQPLARTCNCLAPTAPMSLPRSP